MQEKQKAIEKAVRLLGMRAHSEAELAEKLARSGFSEHAIAEAMQALSKYELTDDKSFAAAWTAARARKGMGPYRIAQELRRKGIDAELADEALASIDEEASLASAVAIARKYISRGDEKAKKRAFDALIRRGFSFQVAREALGIATDESIDEEE